MSLALLFLCLMLNMFRVLIHPSSGACDLFFELFHGLYCSGSMCVGVTLWLGWGGVVSVYRLKHIRNIRCPFIINARHVVGSSSLAVEDKAFKWMEKEINHSFLSLKSRVNGALPPSRSMSSRRGVQAEELRQICFFKAL